MRLVHVISTQTIDLSSVEYFVCDEADRLFELGFIEQIDQILTACTNPKLKRMMFSATFTQGVEVRPMDCRLSRRGQLQLIRRVWCCIHSDAYAFSA